MNSMWLVGGSSLTLTSQQGGGGGSCFNCSKKIIKKISSLASLACVLLINLLYLVRQADKFLSFYFCKRLSYSILMFLLVKPC